MDTGFFGKLPAAGDFVSRGIPAGARAALDHWLTREIAPLAHNAGGWPEGGVRAAVILSDAPWLLVIEPSVDAVDRRYPLVVCCPLGHADRSGADVWADAAWSAILKATEEHADADTLAGLLKRVGLPTAGAEPLIPPVMWWDNTPPGPVAPQLALLTKISSG